jgi:hypothetical protein
MFVLFLLPQFEQSAQEKEPPEPSFPTDIEETWTQPPNAEAIDSLENSTEEILAVASSLPAAFLKENDGVCPTGKKKVVKKR